MVDKSRKNFKSMWNLDKFLTVEEMMLRNKGIYYFSAKRYIPINHKSEIPKCIA
jgi:hypothetical protein